jgi:hypothetical protein
MKTVRFLLQKTFKSGEVDTLARSHDHGSMPKSEIADASVLVLYRSRALLQILPRSCQEISTKHPRKASLLEAKKREKRSGLRGRPLE